MTLRLIILALAIGISFATSAQSYWCIGKINGVYITRSGNVVINGSWRNDWTEICNLNNGVVNTVVCSLWASYAATANQNNLNVQLMYSTGTADCSNIPTYGNAPVPQYFRLDN